MGLLNQINEGIRQIQTECPLSLRNGIIVYLGALEESALLEKMTSEQILSYSAQRGKNKIFGCELIIVKKASHFGIGVISS